MVAASRDRGKDPRTLLSVPVGIVFLVINGGAVVFSALPVVNGIVYSPSHANRFHASSVGTKAQRRSLIHFCLEYMSCRARSTTFFDIQLCCSIREPATLCEWAQKPGHIDGAWPSCRICNLLPCSSAWQDLEASQQFTILRNNGRASESD